MQRMHEPLDLQGHHLAACPRTWRLKKRATPTERMLARICREAGARVRYNAFLRDMNVHRIEVLAQDLPCFGGTQLAVDITLRSVLGSSGEPQPHAADVDGAVLLTARRDKEATYPELATSTRCRLVVVAIETGGRRSEEAVQFIWQLAQAKAQEAPRFLTQQVGLAWERRWTRMLSTVCASSFAASLVEPMSREVLCQTGGDLPTTADVLFHDLRQRSCLTD